MPSGRPPARVEDHLRCLDVSTQTKERLGAVLGVLTGEISVREACERLGVSESRFHELRRQALAGAAEGLTPGCSGRPRKRGEERTLRERELLERVEDLEVDLQAAQIRTELALVMPRVLKPWKGRSSKKNG